MYNFKLPEELIAQSPASPRDHARMLVYSLKDKSITDSYFYNIDKVLPPNSTIVVNNSKVENCRWLFDNNIEVFVIEKLDSNTVRAMVRPGKRFKTGSIVQLTDFLEIKVMQIDKEGIRTLKLNVSHDDVRLKPYEHIPLPPYIAQNDKLSNEYQTVYAKPLGSLAAPTAGLHFTPELITKLKTKHSFTEITLHVGLGTFAKLTDENLLTNKLHSEKYIINQEAATSLNKSSNIVSVGTTTLRTLESVRRNTEMFEQGSYETDIFIRPGFKFNAVDSLITNFHLPSTSLLMLVAALIADKQNLTEADAAKELIRIYKHAISNKYRFYSFGDVMILV